MTKEELIVQKANFMQVIQEKNAAIENYQRTIEGNYAVIESLNLEIDNIIKSSSWRMTKPIREITEYIKRLSRKIRNYSILNLNKRRI